MGNNCFSFLKEPKPKTQAPIELQQPKPIVVRSVVEAPARPQLVVNDGPRSTSEGDDTSLLLLTSVRFDMIDAYVIWGNEAPNKPSYRYEVSYQKESDDNWHDCPKSLIQPANDKGVFCTIANLDPSTTYRIIAKIVSAVNKSIVLAKSQIASETTGKTVSASKLTGYQAISDVESTGAKTEMSLVSGEKLIEESCHNMPPKSGYHYVQKLATGQRGYVPATCISPLKSLDFPGSVTAQDYYFNVNRRTAMVWLLRPNVPAGRFIIRPSSKPDCKALSLRVDNSPIVQHYQIYFMKDGFGCYVTRPAKCFADINELIAYYKKNPFVANMKCSVLTEPFPKYPHPPKLQDIAIPGEMIKLGSYLGNGHFGQVYKATFHNFEVAAKQLKKTGEPEADCITSELMREAEAMAALFHENVVRIIGVCCNEEPQTIVVEYMNKGNLTSFLKNDSEVVDIKLSDVLYLCNQITNGMAYLELHNVIHRDLRTANVLLHQDKEGPLEVKIADFGLTRRLNPDDDIYCADKNTLIPIRWAAPECLENQQFSTKSDVWAFGILFYEVVTLGTTPFPQILTQDVQEYIINGGIITLEDCRRNKRKCKLERELPEEDLCPEPLFKEISRCWLLAPDERPTFAYLANLFENFDLEPIYNNLKPSAPITSNLE